MKLRVFCIALFLVASTPTYAEMLVVTRDGKSFWAISAEKEGEELSFQRDTASAKATMPMVDVFQVIPKVTQGASYRPEEITKAIDTIETTMRAKPAKPVLRKQMITLLAEWKALRRGGNEAEDKVDVEAARYNQSGRDPEVYAEVMTNLEMLRYKNAGGTFRARIDAEEERIKTDYFDHHFAKLQELAGVKRFDMVKWRAVNRYANWVLNAKLVGDPRVRIRKLITEAGEKALEQIYDDAMANYPETPTIADYLAARATLHELQTKLISADADESTLAKVKEAITKVVTRAEASLGDTHYFTYNGFPMLKKDVPKLKRNNKLISNTQFPSQKIDEKCVIYPLTPIESLTFGTNLEIPFRVTWRVTPTPNANYSLMSVIQERSGLTRRFRHPLKSVIIEDGQAIISCNYSVEELPEKFKPGVDKSSGKVILYLYLIDDKTEDQDSVILTQLCALPLSPKAD